MTFDGALIKEQDVTFGVLLVKPHVLNNPTQREEMRRFGRQFWGRVPIVLAVQDARGVPTYQGRTDLVRFLANINPRRIPWKRWTVAA